MQITSTDLTAPLQPIAYAAAPAAPREIHLGDLDDTLASFVNADAEIEFDVRADVTPDEREYASSCLPIRIVGERLYALGSSFEAAVRGAQLLSADGSMGIGDADAAVAIMRAEDGSFVAMDTETVLAGVGEPTELPVRLFASVSNRDRELVALVGARDFADLRR